MAKQCRPKIRRRVSATLRDVTNGPTLILRKSADNLDRLKDQLGMLDLLQPGAAGEFLPQVLQHEQAIRLAALRNQVRTVRASRAELVAATQTVHPRLTLNRAALEMRGGQVDFVPPDRVREHNQLVRQLHGDWVQALGALRVFDEFLTAAGNRIPNPFSEDARNTLAGQLWSAPYVEDLSERVRDYYYRKDRPVGRVFAELEPSKTSR